VAVSDDPDAPDWPDFSTMSVRELRTAHETAATQDVARHLKSFGVAADNVRRGNPDQGEPDAIFDSDHRTLGIELTCVGYYERGSRDSDEFMRRSWGDLQELLRVDGPTILMGPELMNFDAVKTFAQSLLAQKCAKHYSVPTFLVICAVMGHVGLTTADDGPAIVRDLSVPTGCPFERVYLRMQRNVTGEIVLFQVA
jgi:hypothetical protein